VRPVIVAAGQRSAQVLRDLASGRGNLQSAGRALTESSQTFDAEVAKAPCPSEGA
jgi:hypothetical protein